MKCPACAQHIIRRKESDPVPESRAGCNGCAARAVATSKEMQILLDETSSAEDKLQAKVYVRQAIEKTMRGVDYHEARLAVMSWVRALEDKAG